MYTDTVTNIILSLLFIHLATKSKDATAIIAISVIIVGPGVIITLAIFLIILFYYRKRTKNEDRNKLIRKGKQGYYIKDLLPQ